MNENNKYTPIIPSNVETGTIAPTHIYSNINEGSDNRNALLDGEQINWKGLKLLGIDFSSPSYNGSNGYAAWVDVFNALEERLEALENAEPQIIPVSSIVLSPRDVQFDSIGEEATIIATVYPLNATNKAVVWTTENTDIIDLYDDGNECGIKAIGPNPGRAIVTCKATDGSNVSATCTVDCNWPTTVHVSSITLSPPDIQFEDEGEIKTINATVNPPNATNKELDWIIDNTNIALIDEIIENTSCRIEAIYPGHTTLTCRATDGSNKYATCTIDCNFGKIGRISLNESSLTFENLDETFTLTPTIEPANALEGITWTSSNRNVATVDNNGKVTAVGYGTATITCKSDSGEASATCNVTVQENNNTYLYIGTVPPTALNIDTIESSSILFETSKPAWNSGSKGTLNVTNAGSYWLALPVSWGNITIQYGSFPVQQDKIDYDNGERYNNITINGIEHIVRRFDLDEYPYEIWF